jgi:uncharacterized protein YjbI with pentapeptide repeats
MHVRLDKSNLNATKLTNARLDYADFSGAILTNANLCGASSRFANLSAADLEGADLSGADLRHARLDQVNLNAAKLTNARLDYADFAGAILTKANLCGASLHHVKNLTASQLEDSVGSATTVLPPHLQGSVSWSVPKSQTERERRDLRPQARHSHGIPIPHASRPRRKAWRVGVLISFALAITALMWRHVIEAMPLDLSGAQLGSRPFFIEPNLGSNSEDQKSQPPVIRDLTEEKATDRHLIAEAETSPMPSGLSPVDRTENITQQHLSSEPATISEETNAQAKLEPSEGAPLGNQAASTPEDNQESKIDDVSKVSVPSSARSRHAVSDITAESPTATSGHALVPDLSAEISTPDPRSASSVKVPTEAPAVNTLGPFAASGLGDTRPPPAVTLPLPSIGESNTQTLPLNGETPPMPVRNPIRQGVRAKF